MTLFNITFDSETEISQEISKNQVINHNFEITDRNDENSTPQTNSLKKKPTRRTVRFITEEDEKLSTPKSPPRPAPNGLMTIVVTREKKKKINGIRYYFRCFLKQDENNNATMQAEKKEQSKNSKQLYIAKAKKRNSKIIPITDNETIHLKMKTPLAYIEMENENSEFTLIQNNFVEQPIQHTESSPVLSNPSSSQSIEIISNHPSNTHSVSILTNNSENENSTNFESTGQIHFNSANQDANHTVKKNISNIPKHLMVVKFTIPKDHFDGSRKVHISFLENTDVPSPLISLPITSVSGYEGRYMIYSIKNSIIVDEKTRSPIITIRKTESKQLEIDTHFDIPPLWLFGLAIASFLGKKPSH